MKAWLRRWFSFHPPVSTVAPDSESYRDGWNAGYDSARQDYDIAWKAGYRYAKDEWQAAREVEDAELAELAMLSASV